MEDIEKELGASFETIASLGPHGLSAPELSALYTTANEIAPKTLVEIGACHGVSSVVLGYVAKKYGGRLYSVEFRVLPSWQANLSKFGLEGYVSLIQGRSPWIDWTSLPFARIGYLLIDADHHNLPVMVDFYCWGRFVLSGDRIAFHDYTSANPNHQGVRKTVDATAKRYKLRRVTVVQTDRGLGVFERP